MKRETRNNGNHPILDLSGLTNIYAQRKPVQLNTPQTAFKELPTCTGETPAWYCIHLLSEWTWGELDYQAINKGAGQKSPKFQKTHFTKPRGDFKWYESSPIMALAPSHLKLRTMLPAEKLAKKAKAEAHNLMSKNPLPHIIPPLKKRVQRKKAELQKRYEHWKDPTKLTSPVTPVRLRPYKFQYKSHYPKANTSWWVQDLPGVWNPTLGIPEIYHAW